MKCLLFTVIILISFYKGNTQTSKVLITKDLNLNIPKKQDNVIYKNYVGIEVGSKGVKMSFIAISDKKGNNPYKIIKDTNFNTNFVNLDEDVFNPTLSVLTSFYNHAQKEFKVNKDNIFVVVSSGVKNQALRVGKIGFVNKLVDSFKVKIKEPNKVVEIIDGETEARLVHMGVIDDVNRFNTFLIDIGSGNSKGVYFTNQSIKDYKLFLMNWGTKNSTNAVEAILNGDSTIDNFIENIQYVIDGPVGKDLILGINKANVFNTSNFVGFNGGIPWSVATLIKPEFNDSTIIRVTYKEVTDFYKKLEKDFNSVTPDVIYKKYENKVGGRKYLLSETKRVHEVFNRKSLLTGTRLLLKIMRQFTSTKEEKIFMLIKNTQAAWVSAYVNEQVKK